MAVIGVLAACRLGWVPLALALGAGTPASADQAAWEQWQHLVGVVDVGARGDGSLVIMANGHLYQVSRSGASLPFATGPDGFNASADAEAYFVVAPCPQCRRRGVRLER